MTTATNKRTLLSHEGVNYMRNRFADALKGDVEFGGLRTLRWRIAQEEARRSAGDHELLKFAKQIEARWTSIEMEHGRGSLLVEENEISQMLAAPGGRFHREPHWLENARRLCTSRARNGGRENISLIHWPERFDAILFNHVAVKIRDRAKRHSALRGEAIDSDFPAIKQIDLNLEFEFGCFQTIAEGRAHLLLKLCGLAGYTRRARFEFTDLKSPV